MIDCATTMTQREITITIDDCIHHVQDGISILQAAREHQIDIPTLCFLEGLSTVGSCRLCIVNVDGQSRPVTACTTAVREGMVVHTHSETLLEQRRQLLEMLFAAGHHVCAICVSNGHCELQSLAQRLGVTAIHLPNRQAEQDLDLSHKRYGFDPNRCVLCTRCVRACDEIEGSGLWAVVGRGSDAHMEINQGNGWGLSEQCTGCGKCVLACPTAALFDKHASAGEMLKDCALLTQLAEKREQRS